MTEKAQTLLKFIWAKGWPLPLGLALVSTLALWLLTPQASSQVHFESPPPRQPGSQRLCFGAH